MTIKNIEKLELNVNNAPVSFGSIICNNTVTKTMPEYEGTLFEEGDWTIKINCPDLKQFDTINELTLVSNTGFSRTFTGCNNVDGEGNFTVDRIAA